MAQFFFSIYLTEVQGLIRIDAGQLRVDSHEVGR